MKPRATPLGLVLAVLMLVAGAAAAQPEPADLAAGRRLADEYCGMCHAVGSGSSPLPNAPPFRELWRRYPSGGLDQVLTEGMLTPPMPRDERTPRRHPAMPIINLGSDQVAELKAFLLALDRANRGAPP